MIYMELAPSTFLGLCLTVSGILLYFIRVKKKESLEIMIYSFPLLDFSVEGYSFFKVGV